MLLIDANAILRFILFDNVEMANKVCELIEKTKATIRHEVLAEVVYVLNKVYLIPRVELVDSIQKFLKLSNVETESKDVLSLALETFAKTNLDFVDCLLYSFYIICDYDVFTFDKQLNSMFNKQI